MVMRGCGVQEQGDADKARLKQQQEEEVQANRRLRDKVQAEKARVEAALGKLELENKERAEGIRQAEAAAAQARAAELAAEDAKKRDLILQLRSAKPASTWSHAQIQQASTFTCCFVGEIQRLSTY